VTEEQDNKEDVITLLIAGYPDSIKHDLMQSLYDSGVLYGNLAVKRMDGKKGDACQSSRRSQQLVSFNIVLLPAGMPGGNELDAILRAADGVLYIWEANHATMEKNKWLFASLLEQLGYRVRGNRSIFKSCRLIPIHVCTYTDGLVQQTSAAIDEIHAFLPKYGIIADAIPNVIPTDLSTFRTVLMHAIRACVQSKLYLTKTPPFANEMDTSKARHDGITDLEKNLNLLSNERDVLKRSIADLERAIVRMSRNGFLRTTCGSCGTSIFHPEISGEAMFQCENAACGVLLHERCLASPVNATRICPLCRGAIKQMNHAQPSIIGIYNALIDQSRRKAVATSQVARETLHDGFPGKGKAFIRSIIALDNLNARPGPIAAPAKQLDVSKPYRLKIAVCGGPGTGKTALALRFCVDQFSEQSEVTTSTQVFTRTGKCGGNAYYMEIYDFPGFPRIGAPPLGPITGFDGVILVFDSANLMTIMELHDEWLPKIFKHDPGIPAFLVATKVEEMDSHEYRDLHDISVGFSRANRLNGFMSTSGKTGDGVLEVFAVLVRAIFSRYGVSFNDDTEF